MIIGYDSTRGKAIPDALVYEEVNYWIDHDKGPLYSTENVIIAFRVALRQKRIDSLIIQFYENGVYQEDVKVYPSGGAVWPQGCCDTIMELLMELL